ncbi:MAG TPA: LytTR family DNA-binding domain-containing protein [Methylophilus sp.]|nr:LytTR family DNA-binding domain-containing protein [Methylophilus sp.]HQQ32300.1 LytTR family DNA-binding domain-containing protein [Methylophilus sp.]
MTEATAKLQVLIADDEPPARNRLRDLLEEIPDIQIVAEAKNGKEAIELAVLHKPDVLLLDIRMPVMDGLEAAEHLQKLESKPFVIFTTAYDAHAIQAFDLNAIDYLLKPIRSERLQTAIQKAQTLMPRQLEALKPLQKKRSHLSIHERGKVVLVPVEDIIYLRAELKYLTVRTVSHEYLLEESLTNIENEFAGQFLRLHRNCLVAPQYIVGYEKNSGEGENQWVALLKDVPETIAVSRRQQHLIKSS